MSRGASPVAEAGCIDGDVGPSMKRKGGKGRPGEEVARPKRERGRTERRKLKV